MVSAIGSINVNPDEVEHLLSMADFRYPRNSEADPIHGWSHFAAIPGLFEHMALLKRFPRPDEGRRFLMDNCDPRYAGDFKVKRRADKLYLDFARDMHTMGLLSRSDLFGYVEYQKALDLGYNVDFVAGLLSIIRSRVPDEPGDVGVQAQMRAKWGAEDPYELVKSERRSRRGDREWKGLLFLLTNHTRRHAKEIAGCWLFGREHIVDLAEEVMGTLGLETQKAPLKEVLPKIGIQLTFEL